MRVLLLASAVFLCVPATWSQAPESKYDPQLITALLGLVNVEGLTHPTNDDFANTALKDLLVLGTPAGYELRDRYTNLGVSLTQDFAAAADDKRLKDQLVETSRWDRDSDLRSVGLIALAEGKSPDSKGFFQEALNNPKVEIRFTALEALQIWGLPDAVDLYKTEINSEKIPIIRVYAAQALARAGDPAGLDTLRSSLNSADWLEAAMAARYLGDLGTGDDYSLVLDRMVREQSNDFVKAETAIAALKLFPKKQS